MGLMNMLFGFDDSETEEERINREYEDDQKRKRDADYDRWRDEIRQDTERHKQERAQEEARSMIGTP